MSFVAQLTFLTKIRKHHGIRQVVSSIPLPLIFTSRNFDEDQGALSGAVHSAIMYNSYHKVNE